MDPHDEPPQTKSEDSKPLKILTIDGGGLQAISTLLILDRLLETIATSNGVPHRKPRPCDVFDTIGGIGAGGWLAIMLGRFRMDITACLSEWYNITQCIAPRSKSEELRMRLFQHCYFDTDRLIEEIDRLTKLYGTGDCLFEGDPDGARTKHVFVAALKSDGQGYNLFRTYDTGKAKLPGRLLEGPEHPETFKISRAFAVTGAAKYFTPPWKEQMANSGKMRFSDTKFPKPHNITELALDEMWGLYGTDVPLSVVVNIGPGLPSNADIKQIARRFSWGRSQTAVHSRIHSERSRSPASQDRSPIDRRPRSGLNDEHDETEPYSKGLTVQFNEASIQKDPDSTVFVEGEEKTVLSRKTTFGSIKERSMEEKLRRLETAIEEDIKAKLNHFYPNSSQLYYRLALDEAPKGTTKNDASVSGVAFDATLAYLKTPIVSIRIDEIVKRIPVIKPFTMVS
jgi:hypothetical protein